MAPPTRKAPPRSGSGSGSGLPDFSGLKLSDLKSPAFYKNIFMQYHADCFAVICAILIVAYMYNFSAPLAAPFVVINHNTTATDPVEYGTGVQDITFLAFVTALAFVIHDCLRELLWVHIFKRFNLQKNDQARLHVVASYLAYALTAIPLAINCLTDAGVLADLSKVYAGFPHTMLASTKIFLLINIGYYLHLIPLPMFVKDLKARDGSKDHFMADAINIAVYTAAYVFGYSRLSVVMILLQSLAGSVSSLHTILASIASARASTKDQKKQWFKSNGVTVESVASDLATLQLVLTWFSRVVIILLAAYTVVIGVPSNEGVGATQALFGYGVLAVVVLGQLASLFTPTVAGPKTE